MSPHWTHQVARSVSNGRPTAALETHLDDLLLWLSNPDHPRAGELDGAFARQRLGRAQAVEAAYRLLDRLLFERETPPSTDTLGLAPNSDPGVAKQRYRRLMQVYHPDHHPNRAAWATRRTEQINRAFNSVRKGTGSPPPAGAKAGQRPSPSPRRTVDQAIWHPERIREHLTIAWEWTQGFLARLNPIQRRALAATAIALLLLIVLLSGTEEPPKRMPKIIHHPLESAAEAPAPVQTTTPETKPTALGEQTSSPPILSATARSETTPVEPLPPPASDPVPKPTARDAESRAAETQAVSVQPTSEALDAPSQASSELAPPPSPVAHEPQTGIATEPRERTPVTDLRQPEPPPTQPEGSEPSTPRMEIPSPESPTPPSAPEPPLQLSTAPIAPPAIPSITPSVTPDIGTTGEACRTIPDILKRFEHAYQAGALDSFMALYSPLAKENALGTWFAIRETYADWFGKTSARRISFEQLQIKPLPDSNRCAALAVFKVSYLDDRSLLATKAGVIQLLFEPKDSDLLILRVRY